MTTDLEQLRTLRRQVDAQLKATQGFGERLRQLRRERSLTLDQLADLSGVSKPYLSQIENGRVDPPRDEKVARLEEVFGQRPGSLVELAHLARTPEDVRRRLEVLRLAFERTEETIEALLARLPTSPPPGGRHAVTSGQMADLDGQSAAGAEAVATAETGAARSPGRPGRLVPIINRVAAGRPAEYTDLDYPPGVADDYLHAPPGLDDPQAFALRVTGDSMTPRFAEGDIVLFSPAAPTASGDDCFIRFAPECDVAQGGTFKRVYYDSATDVRLQPLNDKYPPLSVPLEQVTSICKAVYRYEVL